MQGPRASVIIRTLDSATTLAETLASVRRQTVAAEVVIVDSGSTDATLFLAEHLADRVVHVAPGTFSFGGALNLGAAAATAPVHVALSSHSALPREDWLAIATEHILDGGAAAACGQAVDGDGESLHGPLRADHAYLMAHQHWGFSNHASAWSAEVWRRHPFDETLPATEDKEWTWRALADGGDLVIDPRLVVSGGHRRDAGVRAFHRRLVKEMTSVRHLRPLEPFGARDALAELARRTPQDPYLHSHRPFGRTRFVEVAARWRASREPDA